MEAQVLLALLKALLVLSILQFVTCVPASPNKGDPLDKTAAKGQQETAAANNNAVAAEAKSKEQQETAVANNNAAVDEKTSKEQQETAVANKNAAVNEKTSKEQQETAVANKNAAVNEKTSKEQDAFGLPPLPTEPKYLAVIYSLANQLKLKRPAVWKYVKGLFKNIKMPQLPQIQLPQIQLPQIQLPQIQLPQGMKIPDIKMPTFKLPEGMKIPDMAMPQFKMPEFQLPQNMKVPQDLKNPRILWEKYGWGKKENITMLPLDQAQAATVSQASDKVQEAQPATGQEEHAAQPEVPQQPAVVPGSSQDAHLVQTTAQPVQATAQPNLAQKAVAMAFEAAKTSYMRLAQYFVFLQSLLNDAEKDILKKLKKIKPKKKEKRKV